MTEQEESREPEWSRRANMVLTARRAAGGRLSVEQGELRFEPHRVDRSLGAEDWRLALHAIRRVTVAPRRLREYRSGGLRRRLCVEAGDQRTYFVVNGVEEVAADLRRAAGVAW